MESKLHIPYVNLEDYSPDTKCFSYIAFADARRYRIIPLFKIEDVLTVAMSDPLVAMCSGERKDFSGSIAVYLAEVSKMAINEAWGIKEK